jgi:hypothetical protein
VIVTAPDGSTLSLALSTTGGAHVIFAAESGSSPHIEAETTQSYAESRNPAWIHFAEQSRTDFAEAPQVEGLGGCNIRRYQPVHRRRQRHFFERQSGILWRDLPVQATGKEPAAANRGATTH